MKKIFYFSIFLLVCYRATYGQVTDDIFKTICKTQYEKDISSRKDDMQNWIREGVLTFRYANELFQGCFKNTKVFLIIYETFEVSEGPHFVPAVYAIDIQTLKLKNFTDIKDFYDFVNLSKYGISNLDKSYLYLYLFAKVLRGKKMQDNVTDPTHYGNEIYSHSEFFQQKNSKILFSWDTEEYLRAIDKYGHTHSLKFLAVPIAQIDSDILHSNNNSITIYTAELIKGLSITYKYKFIFNIENYLSSVKLETYSVNY